MINTAPPAPNSVYGREKLFWYDKINILNHVCHRGAVVKKLVARADKPGSTPGERRCFLFLSREFKIRRLRAMTTVKHATAHDQNHVTAHSLRVVLRLLWVVELFRVVRTTENILLVFCRLGNSRISSFCKNVFNSPALSHREAKYVSCV